MRFKIFLMIWLVLGLVSEAAEAACDGFPSYEQVVGQLFEYQAQNPQLAVLLEIGQSVEGRMMYALRVSTAPDREEMEPEVRIVGGIHGNECQGVGEVMHIIDWLLSGYDTDAQIRRFVDGIEFMFIPLINPDGYARVSPTRTNANNMDLNRNFGFGWSRATLVDPFSEPESRAVRDVSQQNAFVLGLSYHTRANYVNAPWNYTPFYPRDELLLDAIGLDYAGNSDYDVVFGWDWYQTSGDLNDWSLGTQGTFDWTIELTDNNDLVWEVHEPALRAFLEWAFWGIHGIVTDAQTGEPLHAMITISPEGEPMFTDDTMGDYHRVVLDGAYAVTAWAPGYRPVTVENIVVAGSAERVDFQLRRENGYAAGFQINEMALQKDISNAYVAMMGYENNTFPSDALGNADGFGYSMGAGGEITIDMGAFPVVDRIGADFRVVSATQSTDQIRVLVANDQDEPFVEVASGSGTMKIDLNGFGIPRARFVKVADYTDVPFYEAGSGYDLDAVEHLGNQWPDLPAADTAPDTDFPGDGTDGEVSTDTTVDDPNLTATAVSGCTIHPENPERSLYRLLTMIL